MLMASLIHGKRNMAEGAAFAVLLGVYVPLTCGMLVATVLAWQDDEDLVWFVWAMWLIFGAAWPLAVTCHAYARSPAGCHIWLLGGGWMVLGGLWSRMVFI